MVDKDILFTEAMTLFTERGVKMTMDELAGRLHVSKRTLYETVSSKEELASFVIGHYFDIVEEKQRPIREDDSIDTYEKLRLLLTTTPTMPFSSFKINEFAVVYPKAYALLDEKLSTGWDNIFNVIEQGISEGIFRPIDKDFFAAVYTSCIEGLTMGYLDKSGMSFNDMQDMLVKLLLDGITA